MRCPQVKSKLPQGSLAFTVLAILVVGQCNPTQATERPNILWITAEDLSPALGCYGDPDANTPNIDALASRSTKFTHAFANSPVCSTARSCLITGRYATSLGTMHMRSAFPIPADFVGFPALMRDAGYYTSNNVKTDYNIRNPGPFIHECWNESSAQAHWRKRPNQDTPFFAVFNLMESHQSRSMVWPREKFLAEIQIQLSQDQIHAPDSMHLPPYYVDTPIVRQEWARFYDCVSVMDQKVGKLLTQLEDDGLSENTIIFFFGDHGTGMPRHKRALLNTGIHIPLIVHIPNSMRKYAAQIQESETNRLVSFVDFAPTVLEMALIGVPKYMQGVSFAGQSDLRKNAVYAYRDRVDEARDLSRAVRKQDYLYIRNYMPHLGYNQPTAWPDQGALRHEFYEAAEKINSGSSSLTAAQKHFLAPARPFEELYDCRADPQNLRNLAGETQFQRRLDELRRELDELLVTSGDRGFIPEAKLMAIMDEPNAAIDSAAKRFREAAEQAWATEDEDELWRMLQGSDAARYWASLRVRSWQGDLPETLKSTLLENLDLQQAWIAVEAAATLAHLGEEESPVRILGEMLQNHDLNIVLQAMREVEMLGEKASSLREVVTRAAKKYQSMLPTQTTATFEVTPEQDLAMFIGFSARAFLQRN